MTIDNPIIDEHGRPEPPVDQGETATLVGFLDYQRATLEWKTRGLDSAGLTATTAASTMTLGGLLNHLALVEDHWFSEVLHGADSAEPWKSVDWEADRDWEWHTADQESPETLRGRWQASVDRSRELLARALTSGDLGQRANRAWVDGRSPNLRWIITHMIEEYARHNGHADLLRESVDGQTGE